MKPDDELLPVGSRVGLEVYTCTVRMQEGESSMVAVTCDVLGLALVIEMSALNAVQAEHNVEPWSERAYYELAAAFKLQCNNAVECTLWDLDWGNFLDRRLVATIQLEII